MIKIAKFDEEDYETYKDFVNSIKNVISNNELLKSSLNFIKEGFHGIIKSISEFLIL